MYVAKLVVPTDKQLEDAKRPEDDGPQPLEGDQENDVPLVTGDSYTVLLMARGRCKCMIQVRAASKSYFFLCGLKLSSCSCSPKAHCKHGRRFFFPRIV